MPKLKKVDDASTITKSEKKPRIERELKFYLVPFFSILLKDWFAQILFEYLQMKDIGSLDIVIMLYGKRKHGYKASKQRWMESLQNNIKTSMSRFSDYFRKGGFINCCINVGLKFELSHLINFIEHCLCVFVCLLYFLLLYLLSRLTLWLCLDFLNS